MDIDEVAFEQCSVARHIAAFEWNTVVLRQDLNTGGGMAMVVEVTLPERS
jgi:hypothetical protein